MLRLERGKAGRSILHPKTATGQRLSRDDGRSIWRRVMNGRSLQSHRLLSARRIALLAATVAGLGVAILVLAPRVAPNANLFGSAQAQNLTEKVQQLPQRPVGFADIVEKVKPAVISVRVKVERPAGLSTMN